LADEADFNSYLEEFVLLPIIKKDYLSTKLLGFDDSTGRLVMMRINAQTFGKRRDSRGQKLPLYN